MTEPPAPCLGCAFSHFHVPPGCARGVPSGCAGRCALSSLGRPSFVFLSPRGHARSAFSPPAPSSLRLSSVISGSNKSGRFVLHFISSQTTQPQTTQHALLFAFANRLHFRRPRFCDPLDDRGRDPPFVHPSAALCDGNRVLCVRTIRRHVLQRNWNTLCHLRQRPRDL